MAEIEIPLKGVTLGGDLVLPEKTSGLVVFAHGSGSSRHSPRNQFVAGTLRRAGMATLLFDLLTSEEEASDAYSGQLRFNIRFLAERLAAATQWVLDQAITPEVSVGYFGASTGAAAALVAAGQLGEAITAVVSRGGRPDLAGDCLESVTAATLLIVGGNDSLVIRLNEDAYTHLPGEKALRIIPGASHLFEEGGALEKVADMASEWFSDHLHPMKAGVG